MSKLRVLPAQLLEAADRIRSQSESTDHGAMRGIVHLAYYAAYHCVCGKLNLSTTNEARAKHRVVARQICIYSDNDPTLKAAKINFSSLMSLRFRSDYDLSDPIMDYDADDALDWAHNILDN